MNCWWNKPWALAVMFVCPSVVWPHFRDPKWPSACLSSYCWFTYYVSANHSWNFAWKTLHGKEKYIITYLLLLKNKSYSAVTNMDNRFYLLNYNWTFENWFWTRSIFVEANYFFFISVACDRYCDLWQHHGCVYSGALALAATFWEKKKHALMIMAVDINLLLPV